MAPYFHNGVYFKLSTLAPYSSGFNLLFLLKSDKIAQKLCMLFSYQNIKTELNNLFSFDRA